jgi:hypothetical protein
MLTVAVRARIADRQQSYAFWKTIHAKQCVRLEECREQANNGQLIDSSRLFREARLVATLLLQLADSLDRTEAAQQQQEQPTEADAQDQWEAIGL